MLKTRILAGACLLLVACGESPSTETPDAGADGGQKVEDAGDGGLPLPDGGEPPLEAGTTPDAGPDPLDALPYPVRLGVDFSGAAGIRDSYEPSMSGDGRFVAFTYDGSGSGPAVVLLTDVLTGTVEAVSVDSGGEPANSDSDGPGISLDGTLVEFRSEASNLVPTVDPNAGDVYVREVSARNTRRRGLDEPSVAPSHDRTGDGRFEVFESQEDLVDDDTNHMADIYLRDTQNGAVRRVSVNSSGLQANGLSGRPTISADGRYVAFVSGATNLVAGDSNGALDIFVRDLQAATTVRVSVNADGEQANGSSYEPQISANGRRVVFASSATNLYPDDTNRSLDVFVAEVP